MEREEHVGALLNQDHVQPAISTPYSRKKQMLATVCVTLGCLLNGCAIGYTGPAIPSLMSNTSSLTGQHTPLQLQEASWVTSVLSLGCFLGCLLAAPTMEKIGRKKCLLWISSLNYALGFGLIFLANSSILIYIGRFLNGVGLGLVLSTVSVYIIEIASIDMRGFLGCFVQFQGSIGVLFTFCGGYWLNWWQLAASHLVLVVPFFIAMWFVPESPRWLIMKGNEWEGEVALKWLRGRNSEGLDREIDQIKREIAVRKRERVSIQLLLQPEVIKPFLVCMMMMFFLQLSGLNVMVFYCVVIFQQAGSSIDPNLASIIVGVVLLLSCFVALGVVSRMGRKVILIVSILGMAVCHATLGTCFHFYTRQSTPAAGTEVSTPVNSTPGWEDGKNPLGMVPILAVVGFLFLGNVGYGTLIWVVTAELLPPKVRSVANSIIICFAFVTGFLVAKTFADLVQGIGYDGTFWLYACICTLGGLCTFIFVPETRDKTFDQIQNHFRYKGRKVPLGETSHPLETVS